MPEQDDDAAIVQGFETVHLPDPAIRLIVDVDILVDAVITQVRDLATRKNAPFAEGDFAELRQALQGAIRSRVSSEVNPKHEFLWTQYGDAFSQTTRPPRAVVVNAPPVGESMYEVNRGKLAEFLREKETKDTTLSEYEALRDQLAESDRKADELVKRAVAVEARLRSVGD